MPGAVDVMGVAFATNPVTVNNQTAYRKGEYFRQQLTVNNASTPVWQSVTVAATNQTSVSGNQFVARTPEQFSYDADGNLTTDGRWMYGWDAENRLVTLTTNTGVGPQQSIKFEYDWKGRRIRKQVWPNTGWSGTLTSDVKFVYDGWNLLAELNATNNPVIRSYMWGSDLSGTIQGAGGVGGLLEVVYKGAQTTNCFIAFDGNGNVSALADAGSTNILARYEYGPFGELLRATGPMAKANPFRFSTIYQDDETDLLMYPNRPYSASQGRFLSHDPLDELSFRTRYIASLKPKERLAVLGRKEDGNEFNFVQNEPIGHFDVLGLCPSGTKLWITLLAHPFTLLASGEGAAPRVRRRWLQHERLAQRDSRLAGPPSAPGIGVIVVAGGIIHVHVDRSGWHVTQVRLEPPCLRHHRAVERHVRGNRVGQIPLPDQPGKGDCYRAAAGVVNREALAGR